VRISPLFEGTLRAVPDRFELRVNLKFCQDYPTKSGEKTEGHVARSPRALSRVLPLELKGQLDCRMCPELLLNLVATQKV
jgi:hypothetical protein